MKTLSRLQRPKWLSTELVLGLLILIGLLLVATTADARPGGGSSYSGGGSRSSGGSRGGGSYSGGGYRSSSGAGGGGGGGGGGGDAGLFLFLLFEHPAIGIPVVLFVVGFLVVRKLQERGETDWSSSQAATQPSMPEPVSRVSLEPIRAIDPNFSRIVFEDFLYSLYAEVHRARGLGALNKLSAYFSRSAAEELMRTTRGPVEGVILGAMRVLEANASPSSGARVVLELEANYTEAGRGAYVVERWTLTRGPNARSRAPRQVRVLGCPNCGAPQEQLFGGNCRHCQRVVNDGSFDWTVQSVQVLRREERPPIVGSSAEEQGTDEPTVYDPNVRTALGALQSKDAAFDVHAFYARVGLIFQQFQLAWTTRDLAPMRPFLSDALFTTQAYWVSAYRAQRMRNVTDGARITNLEVVSVQADAFYDAVTVRLYASGLDYTVTDDGKHVSGSTTTPRAYSEYWTLIRGTNRKGPTRTDLACSNCGAPIAVNMVGECNYCKVKVTTGDFDWVLSRIEQDESYTN